METICRLVRVLQCPHECGHALLISQGSPGMSTNLAQLVAHLCGYSVFRINSSALTAADRYTLDSFKADLVSAYTRAGVKVISTFFEMCSAQYLTCRLFTVPFFSVCCSESSEHFRISPTGSTVRTNLQDIYCRRILLVYCSCTSDDIS